MKYTIYHRLDEDSKKCASEFSNYLDKNKFKKDDLNPDIVISIGGDGTFLRAVYEYKNILNTVKFVGVKTGTLGFLTSYNKEDHQRLVNDLLSSEYKLTPHRILDCYLCSDEKCIRDIAINELTLVNPKETQIVEVNINTKPFETLRGTGLCVSTPLGSTGYNKSLNGSLISTNLDAFQLTEIASINNNVYKTLNNPIILSSTCQLDLKAVNTNGVTVTLDNRSIEVKNYKYINIKLHDNKLNVISKKEDTFYSKVKKAFL